VASEPSGCDNIIDCTDYCELREASSGVRTKFVDITKLSEKRFTLKTNKCNRLTSPVFC
jgi:hypothetical protein